MNTNFCVLVVDDDINSLKNMEIALKSQNYFVETATTYEEAVSKLNNIAFDLLVTDLIMPYKDGLDLAEYAINKKFAKHIILVTGYGDEKSVERALKLGVKDFIRKPFDNSEFVRSVEKIYRMHKLEVENEYLKKKLQMENEVLREQLSLEKKITSQIVGKSRALLDSLSKAKEIARFSEMCLIQGESGTGKELLAKYIHKSGPRKDYKFIAVNCAELSPQLFESELFGYVKGAFTGANEDTPGLFEVANKGILFLDEISEIPSALQAKLLRVVETKKIRRIGDNEWREVDVQIIASTNRQIDELMEGKFIRQDLFHRLSASVITLPPLRERKEDIPLLMEYYLKIYSNTYSKKVPMPSEELMKSLKNAEWKGNIRQFSNFVRNYVLFGEISNYTDFNRWLSNGHLMDDNKLTFHFPRGTLEELEQAKLWLVKKILARHNNNKSKAAKHLGMSYPGLHGLLKKIGMEEEENGKKN